MLYSAQPRSTGVTRRKRLKDMPFDICRMYVHDLEEGQLTEDDLKRIHGWIRSRNIPKLASCSSVLPNALSTRERFRVLMQIEAFFKKNSSLADAKQLSEATVAAFDKNEVRCRITNKRLDHFYLHLDRLDPDMQLMIARAQRYIARVLGPFNERRDDGTSKGFLNQLPKLVRYTAGATATRSRKNSQPHKKVGLCQDYYTGTSPYFDALAKSFGYRYHFGRHRDWNRVVQVSKSYKINRTIACEQDGSLPFQLAFDVYGKRRLRRFGINLSDQTWNQLLAYLSSKHGYLATIDMEAASDTVAFNTVAWLLPNAWFQYLNAHRAISYKRDAGGSGIYAKFSSMGNGATFVLETLIFASLCYAVGSKDFSVYGDDIIIESELVPEFLKLARFFGFRINLDKSHIEGPFRESCGVNYYQGVDITPFYMRRNPTSKADQSHLVNGLAAIAKPGGQLWNYALDLTIENRLLIVPINPSTISGVFVDAHTAWKLKKLTTRDPRQKRRSRHTWIPMFYAYKAEISNTYVGDSGTLFLWQLDKFQGVEGHYHGHLLFGEHGEFLVSRDRKSVV